MAGFWRRLWQGKEATSRSLTVDQLLELFEGSPTKAGQRVNINTALRVATVLACARVLAEGIAQVPLKLFRASEDERTRTPAKDHPAYWLLHRRPNEWQTSFEFRETLMLHCVLGGNAYAFKNIVGGKLAELILLDPGRVSPHWDESKFRLTYKVTGERGGTQEFPASAIWHVRGPSWDARVGLNVVRLAREAIGLSMAIEEQQAKFYELGAVTSGMISVDGTLNEEQHKKLRSWIEKEHAGSRNAWRPMILDHAAKWLQQTMSNADAQTLEQRKYQVEEICRAARVMPIMVGVSDKATTYASAEQMFLAHVVHTLSPWYERLEQSMDAHLLTSAELEKQGLYFKFIVQGLLRGALKDTSEFLTKLVLGGILTRNEAREKLEFNPIEGLDEPLTPTNMALGNPTATDPVREGDRE